LNAETWNINARTLLQSGHKIAAKKKDAAAFPKYAAAFPDQLDNGDIRVSKEEERSLQMLEKIIEEEFFKQ
jgi:hypothetical protein